MSRRLKNDRHAMRDQPDLFGSAPNVHVSREPSPANDVAIKAHKPSDAASPENNGNVAPQPAPKVRPAEKSLPAAKSYAGRLLDVRAAAAWLGLSKSTLDKMRCYGQGPRFIRATGKAVRYDPDDLAAFAESRRQNSTSEALARK